jgi:hypothetical protein
MDFYRNAGKAGRWYQATRDQSVANMCPAGEIKVGRVEITAAEKVQGQDFAV